MTAFWVSSNDARPLTRSTVAGQRDSTVLQSPPDDLVDGVVSADVLADDEHRAVGVEQRRSVQATGGGENPSGTAQFVGHRRQGGGSDHGGIVTGEWRLIGPDGVDRTLTAHPARRGGVEVARHVHVGHDDVRCERHVEDVVGVDAVVAAPRQYWTARMSSRRPITPSVSRNPCASSISEPGVRIVTVMAVPFSGSPSVPRRQASRPSRSPNRR